MARSFRRNVFACVFCAPLICLLSAATMAQTYTVLYAIPDQASDVYGPSAQAIAQGRNGDLYTTAPNPLSGELFSATTSGVLTPLYNVYGFSYSGATVGTDGNLYGTNQDGGTGNSGIVYKVTPAGVETVLHNFNGTTDGYDPGPTLVEAPNGLFYGVTTSSSPGYGTIYSVSSSGTFNVLHTFGGSDGEYPHAGLTVGSDGNLYGGTSGGGANNWGVLFKITPSGTYTVLYNLCSQAYCGDGADIETALTLGPDGNLYGTTYRGGSYGAGAFFRLTNSGTYTVINGGVVGENPTGVSLTLGTDGNFYGIYSNTAGPIYSLTTSGVVTILHSFCQDTNCTDGSDPSTPLIQDTNGTFYGFTSTGGVSGQCNSGDGCGVFYSLDMGLSAFARLGTTSGKEGAKIGIFGQGFSKSSVVEFGGTAATKVTLSGTTYLTATVPSDALTGPVTVTTGSTTLTSSQNFSVLPTAKTFTPTSGPVGTLVTITGTGLTQTTLVEFNGKSASFTVVSDTEITATVPTGATTGKIEVTTQGGSVTSSSKFTVN